MCADWTSVGFCFEEPGLTARVVGVQTHTAFHTSCEELASPVKAELPDDRRTDTFAGAHSIRLDSAHFFISSQDLTEDCIALFLLSVCVPPINVNLISLI